MLSQIFHMNLHSSFYTFIHCEKCSEFWYRNMKFFYAFTSIQIKLNLNLINFIDVQCLIFVNVEDVFENFVKIH